MINESEIVKFFQDRKIAEEKCKKINDLIDLYKSKTPTVIPRWDLTEDAMKHINICNKLFSSGLALYKASINDIWCYINDASLFEGNTLWSNRHDNAKIANVIYFWENSKELTPIFLMKHLTRDLLLVADGKHRLTVTRYMNSVDVYFYLELKNCKWLSDLIPTINRIR